jgi:hypothetical protein
LLINDEGGAQYALHDLAVHIFLAPRAVFFHERMIGVREQCERQAVFLNEFLMRSLTVGADADDFNVAFGSFFGGVAEPARFLRSSRRVVFRIKKQHDFFPFEIR